MKDVMDGGLDGRRVRGRPRIAMLDELKEGSSADEKESREYRKIEVWVPVGCYKSITYHSILLGYSKPTA